VTIPYDDPPNAPFWEAASERRLVVQRCDDCGQHQMYARVFCLACEGRSLSWAQVAGTGTVYSQVTVRFQVVPELEPPYLCALVELDEGPRLLTTVEGEGTAIGDRVEVRWRDRDDEPPLPVFARVP
jgi:uncharacterized protein